MRSPARLPPQLTFGGRIPAAVGLVIAITVALSLIVVLGDRHAGSVLDLVVFRPRDVWHGELWRLLTWAFVETSPLGLIFQCLFLYWFGKDLVNVWGTRRFLTMYGGMAVLAAIGTCALARLDAALLDQTYSGGWTLTVAMTVAWGLYFPDRVIRIYFILPIRGMILAWATVGLTIVFAIYSGWEHLMPELVAEGAMLAFLFRGKILRRVHEQRAAWALRKEANRRTADKKDREKKRAASVSYLKVVESHDDDKPNLPPDVDAKLNELLGTRAKRDRTKDN